MSFRSQAGNIRFGQRWYFSISKWILSESRQSSQLTTPYGKNYWNRTLACRCLASFRDVVRLWVMASSLSAISSHHTYLRALASSKAAKKSLRFARTINVIARHDYSQKTHHNSSIPDYAFAFEWARSRRCNYGIERLSCSFQVSMESSSVAVSHCPKQKTHFRSCKISEYHLSSSPTAAASTRSKGLLC